MRIRFRIWTLLVAVALAAVLLGGWQAHVSGQRRAAQLSAKSVAHAANADRHAALAQHHALLSNEQPERADFHLRRVGYHIEMVRKYERAAAEPWKPVGYDPSPP